MKRGLFVLFVIFSLQLVGCDSGGGSGNGNGGGNEDSISPPEQISVTMRTISALTLSWSPVSEASSYNIYTSNAEDGEYLFYSNQVGTAGVVIGLKFNTTVWIKITSVGSNDESKYSKAISGTTSPESSISSPLNVLVTSEGMYDLTVSWDSVSGAISYNVYSSNTQNGAYSFCSKVTESTYSMTSLDPGSTKWFKITSVDNIGEGCFSDVVSGTTYPSTSLPSVPNINVNLGEDYVIDVTWNPCFCANYYEIYTSDSEYGTYSLYDTSYNCASYFSANPSTTVWFKVKAVNDNGSSSFSSPESATTLPPPPIPSAPGDISISSYYDQINLNWDSVDGADLYEVYVSNSETGTYVLDGTAYNTSYYIIIGYSTTKWVKLKAVNEGGKSEFSAAASGTTEAEPSE